MNNKLIFYKCVIFILYLVKYDIFIDLILKLRTHVKIFKYNKNGLSITYIGQKGFDFTICGDLKKFSMHPTGHLKSDTFIECSGGVKIGKYFHCGSGLTIFSTNHNYNSNDSIPYDENDIHKPVIIGDFVWVGANVSIVPGAVIGDGAIIGMGSVVTSKIPPCAIAVGNPARVVGFRDISLFNRLKKEEKFY